MKLVLSVSAIGEQAEGRCPWMWIDLSPPLAQKALERIDEATFFNPWLAAPETKQEEEGIAIEDLLEQLCVDDRDWAEVPDELTIPEWATVRIEESQKAFAYDPSVAKPDFVYSGVPV